MWSILQFLKTQQLLPILKKKFSSEFSVCTNKMSHIHKSHCDIRYVTMVTVHVTMVVTYRLKFCWNFLSLQTRFQNAGFGSGPILRNKDGRIYNKKGRLVNYTSGMTPTLLTPSSSNSMRRGSCSNEHRTRRVSSRTYKPRERYMAVSQAF